MTDIATLGIEVEPIDLTNVKEATESFDALAQAIERSVAALKSLDEVKHGGVHYVSVGGVTECTVKPFEG